MPVRIRTFQSEDHDAVFDLYGRVFGAAALERFTRRWQWQFFDNPVAGRCPSVMWVAERGDVIVGYLASFPRLMKVLDRERVVFHDCDLIVAPNARRQGIGQLLVEAYDACAMNPLSNCLAYAPANGRIRLRLGYRPARIAPRYFRPYKLGVIARLALGPRRENGTSRQPDPVRGVQRLGTALNPVLAGLNAVRRPRATPGYAVEAIDGAGPEIDELWRRVAPCFPLVGVRDRDFVRWRFMQDPVFRHTVLAARDRSGDLVGYVALRVHRRDGITEGRIMDLFCSPERVEVIDSLMLATLEHMELKAVDFVYCLGLHPGIRRVVRRYLYAAPSRLNGPAWLLWKGGERLKAVVYDEANWHISQADSDIGFAP